MRPAKMRELVGFDGLRRAFPRSDRVIVETCDNRHRVDAKVAADIRVVQS